MTRSQAKTSLQHPDTGIWLIAIFKLVKGLLLLAIGLGVASLLHKNVAAILNHWTHALGLPRESRYVRGLLSKLAAIGDGKLEIAEITTFIYSALLLTEGTGLLLQKRWAEYLTVIATASFIPVEMFAVARRFDLSRIIILLINVAVVWYLCRTLWRERKTR